MESDEGKKEVIADRIKTEGFIIWTNSQARSIVLVGNEWDKSDLHYSSSSELLNRASTEIRIEAIFAATGVVQNCLSRDWNPAVGLC